MLPEVFNLKNETCWMLQAGKKQVYCLEMNIIYFTERVKSINFMSECVVMLNICFNFTTYYILLLTL